MKPKDQNKKKNSKGKYGCGFLVVFFIATLAGFLGLLYYFNNQYQNTLNQPLSESEEIVEFQIDEGQSVDQIISDLVTEGFITERESFYLKIYLRVNQLGGTLQAGSFQIPRNLSMTELVVTLQSAGIPEVWITILEGLRYDEIAEVLDRELSKFESSNFNKENFLRLVQDQTFINSLALNATPLNLEGFLFPDKYLVAQDSTEEDIIILMTDNFKQKVGSDYTYEDIILASLLEREGRSSTEKKMIADIMDRRLAEGWFLNIDASLLYHFKDWEHELTKEDVETDYEYNTYTRLGLPPTPICNPGLDSIEAVMSPTPNEYYYYLHDTDGIIHYAETYEQHTVNIYNYLQ